METEQRRWCVVKIGGELAQDVPKLAATLVRSVAHILARGHRVLVVHGGGPQATALSRTLAVPTVQVHGQRVTDAATLEVMKMTVGGVVSVDVAAAFRQGGVRALCTTGVSAGLVVARRRPPVSVPGQTAPVDYGLVGDIVRVDAGALAAISDAGFVPVLGCLAADDEGHVYNVNADTVAAAVAEALAAERLFLVSNVPGVLRNRDVRSSRIPRLTPSAARALVESGVVSGGMIPKVEESIALLARGIGAVHILTLEQPEALQAEWSAPGSVGTVFVPDA